MTIRPSLLRGCLSVAALISVLQAQGHAAVRQGIAAPDLLQSRWSGGLVSNVSFMAPANAAAAHAPFLGALQLTEIQMSTEPVTFLSRTVLGRDPRLFPGVALAFFTDKGDLVPFSQDVIRSASAGRGHSFWDIIVQPGRVWSQPGDGGWSRAAFPFALVNSLEGETHNGLATFIYRDGQVSNLRFQIVQQTSPFYVKDYFTAAGLVPASLGPAGRENIAAMTLRYEASLADAVRIADWSELAAKVGGNRLAGFDGSMPMKDIVLAGLDYRGTFYLKECQSAAGPLPWCDRARFGVWSATKALANETALLRLAQKYGPAVFELRIQDYVPGAGAYAGWHNVRFEDAIDMATGIGNGSLKREPNHITDGYLDSTYSEWYEAPSEEAKVASLLRDGRTYPWGPGKVARYRDQDMYVLGVAMDNFLKSKEGPSADIWTMLETEVFVPIGVHYAPINRTIEKGGSAGQPLMAFGYYPTIGDLVHIARLYQNDGRQGQTQILYAPRIRELAAGPKPRGLPTGEQLAFGETGYVNAFWVAPYDSARGCRIYYPRMIGWGGNIVALMPGGVTGIRLAKSDESGGSADVDTAGMAGVVDRLVKFCD